jgi:hypothetical protein
MLSLLFLLVVFGSAVQHGTKRTVAQSWLPPAGAVATHRVLLCCLLSGEAAWWCQLEVPDANATFMPQS